MIKSIVAYAFTCALLLAGQAVSAQETAVAFSGLKHDSNLPVEITADQLSVDQASGKATFAGNVVIGQGSMRLTAGHVEVIYSSDDSGNIAVLDASNGVTLTNGGEAVEANSARYDLNSGEVILAGSVLLTQGSNAISGDKMTIDLETGTGLIDGRVKTILQPGRVK
ncbi:lipopolysaccharide transport periplasmic protein LptA [Celeribacter marinus]|uniref:lipopolysaccharide transport periplasmic protein LptA n=1 Tax=Celeribacter marinus TaxID=1397108 RepID=UPI003F6C48C8